MGKRTPRITATKLRRYVLCSRLPYLDEFAEADTPEETQANKRRYSLGVEHEESVALTRGWVTDCTEDFLGKPGTVPAPPETVDQVEWTLEQMKQGTPVVAQGLLRWKDWSGRPDWLVRRDGHSRFGSWYYEPQDAKYGRKASPRSRVIPVGFYALLLEHIQGRRPEEFRLHLGQEVTCRTEDHADEVMEVIDELKNMLMGEKDPGPHLTTDCKYCVWLDVCKSDARAM